MLTREKDSEDTILLFEKETDAGRLKRRLGRELYNFQITSYEEFLESSRDFIFKALSKDESIENLRYMFGNDYIHVPLVAFNDKKYIDFVNVFYLEQLILDNFIRGVSYDS